jgi:hypothetical protein
MMNDTELRNGTAGLSEVERVRIREEEQLRFEVRQSFEKAAEQARRSRLGAFLNSSLGLWLLSAIFITGAGAVYQRCEAELSGRRVRLDAIARLDREISYRLSETLGLLKSADGHWDFQTAKFGIDPGKPPSTDVARRLAVESYGDAQRIAASLSSSPDSAEPAVYPPLYPQFASYSTPALMAELATLVPPAEQKSIDESRAKVTALHGGIGVVRPNSSAAEQVASFLLRAVMLPRWRNKSFLYTTCGESEPFCQDSGLPALDQGSREIAPGERSP